MAQGSRDGISLAHARALKLVEVARRLSLVAAMFVIAVLLAGTAGTSYAGGPTLEDSVVVSNYGGAFNGSLESFCGELNWLPTDCAAAGRHSAPVLRAAGPSTLLGSSTGAAGDAVSSLDDHIAVAVPLDLVDQTCFGEPALGVSFPASCISLLDLGGAPVPPAPFAGTGFVEIFSPGANGNTAPETIIGTRNVAFSVSGSPDVYTYAPPTTGVNTPQGVAFESPFDGNPLVPPGHGIIAIANTLPDVVGPNPTEPACAAFGGITVGSITEFDTSTLQSGYNDDAVPFQSSVVFGINEFQIIHHNKIGTKGRSKFPDTLLCSATQDSLNYECFGPPYEQNVTIGGCSTFLLAPVNLTFDEFGNLFVVNNALTVGVPSFVDVFPAFEYGDILPEAIVGLLPPSAGDVLAAVGIAVESGPIDPETGFPTDTMFLSDGNSVKIFAPFDGPTCDTDAYPFGCLGTQLGAIEGPATKLDHPTGLALGLDDALYVVNQNKNSLEMFTDVPDAGGDIAPTLIISGPATKINVPIGVALPQFTPTPEPSSEPTTDAARD